VILDLVSISPRGEIEMHLYILFGVSQSAIQNQMSIGWAVKWAPIATVSDQ
jgi:hypothetical protein